MTAIDMVYAIGILLILLVQILLWKRTGVSTTDDQAQILQNQLQMSRTEVADASKNLREEVGNSIGRGYESLTKTLAEMGKGQVAHLAAVQTSIKELVVSNQAQIERLRGGVGEELKELRTGNEKKLEAIQNHIKGLTDSNQAQIEKLQKTVSESLKDLQASNEKKLDEMRKTVDEKLQTTLEKRLGASFKLVSERLEAVQRGLGEMKGLADGVGDLKRVLTNVKARGTWGEVQLAAILEQLLTEDQYQANVKTKAGSEDLVEFAIKLPGAADAPGSCVYLPIDSKFPQEDYLRLQDASEKADVAGVEESTKALIRAIKSSAKDISEKYIDPPNTTDFAIMFLPTEGLYAEVLRQPGLMEDLQSSHRIVVTGPTTLSAVISSLRLGFRTLAIEKRSAEVWQVLSAVKTEFKSFGTIMEKVKRQLGTVSKTIDRTQVRTRAMERNLRNVESLPVDEAASLLGLDHEDDLAVDELDDE